MSKGIRRKFFLLRKRDNINEDIWVKDEEALGLIIDGTVTIPESAIILDKGRNYWTPTQSKYAKDKLEPTMYKWSSTPAELALYEKGWIFKSFLECKLMIPKIKDEIDHIKENKLFYKKDNLDNNKSGLDIKNFS